MRADQDIVHHAEIAEHTAKLEGARNGLSGELLRRKTGDGVSVEMHLAGVGPVRPVTRLNRVVLPAPFGPMMLTSSPAARSRSIASTAVSPPNRRVKPRRE